MDRQAYISERVAEVKEKAAKAAARGGFAPPTLVAVTKKMTDEELLCTLRAGVTDIGENYPQSFARRRELLEGCGLPMPRMHLIGSLQTNKIKLILGKTDLLHSLDSERLALALEKAAQRAEQTVPLLLEINCGREASKGGIFPEAAQAFGELVQTLPHLRLLGLMTMAPLLTEKESYRPFFREVRGLFEKMKENGAFATETPVLSMGMSGSYEIAAEEGATLIRVGQALYT